MQADNAALLFTIPDMLAKLLNVASRLIEFRDVGTRICRTILTKDCVGLIGKGLDPKVPKERLISPCLMLLTEIVSFDGGSLSSRIYAHRDVTLKRLEKMLSIRTPPKTAYGSASRPQVRASAVRYLLANLRYQAREIKEEILKDSSLVRSLFQDLAQDSPEIINATLDTLSQNVLVDDAISRATKNNLMTNATLSKIASLYHYGQDVARKEVKSVQDACHDFLLMVCTTPDRGVLVKQYGWYPPGTESTELTPSPPNTTRAALGHANSDTYIDKVPVRNVKLATFLYSLQTNSHVQQKRLALAIFQSAPELVADFFLRSKNVVFDPKLSATWVGYCAFVHSVVNLPVPSSNNQALDHSHAPPPASVVLQSVIPKPLTRHCLTKCLNRNSDLAKFLVIRLLTAILEKFQRVLLSFEPTSAPEWRHAAECLSLDFCARFPEARHVISVFHSNPKDKPILREVIARLLSLYYQVIPQMIVDVKVDLSMPVAELLEKQEASLYPIRELSWSFLELEHYVEITFQSSDMKWWQRPCKFCLPKSAKFERGQLIVRSNVGTFTFHFHHQNLYFNP